MQLTSYLGPHGHLAICNPETDDSGWYGRAALKAMGLWDAVEGRLAFAGSVQAELSLVTSGKAALGVAFNTDANPLSGVRVVAEFPDGCHPPIVYPVALTADAGADAVAFLGHLKAAETALVFPASCSNCHQQGWACTLRLVLAR